jgi:NDP-sugar pyrophosphorylase family protein
MILAAGLGTRMAPISERRAKVVLPLLDEPLVLRMVRSLAAEGVTQVIVNEHAFADQVRAALENPPIPVDHVFEPTLRGSGGGILGARRFLESDEPFLVLNADMVIDLDLAALREAHARAGTLATMVLRDEQRKHEFPTIGYGQGTSRVNLVRRITNRIDLGDETGCGLFAGVHVLESRIFDHMPDRLYFDSMPDLYTPLLRQGEHVVAWLQPDDAVWWPVGTPRELLDANLLALEQASAEGERAVLEDPSARVEGQVSGPAWIGARARVPRGAKIGPGSVIGADALVPEGAHVRDSLFLPGARPGQGTEFNRAIAHDEEVWRDD